jgi:tRNA (cytidine/uridine-2'-O-)-methyltransferase
MRKTPTMETIRLPKFHIVLIEPEIPPNTGNIARLSVGVGATLHLVGKLGFRTDEKHLRRAGLDYWEYLDLHYHDSFSALQESYPEGRFFYASRKGKRRYTEVNYREGDFLVFGKETKGLPDDLLRENADRTITIPMTGRMRSLNLSNAVAIVSYEMIRQHIVPTPDLSCANE